MSKTTETLQDWHRKSVMRTRVKRLRRALGMTQKEMGDKIGVSYITVNRWEKGHHKPSSLALMKIRNLEDSI